MTSTRACHGISKLCHPCMSEVNDRWLYGFPTYMNGILLGRAVRRVDSIKHRKMRHSTGVYLQDAHSGPHVRFRHWIGWKFWWYCVRLFWFSDMFPGFSWCLMWLFFQTNCLMVIKYIFLSTYLCLITCNDHIWHYIIDVQKHIHNIDTPQH